MTDPTPGRCGGSRTRRPVSAARALPLLAVLAALPLAGCRSSAPVDRAQWEMVSQRLLHPFLTDSDVACGELLIEISPNYYPNIGQPSVDTTLHSARKERGDGYDETIWTNRVGDLSGAFALTIGAPDEFTDKGLVRGKATRFTVLHEVRLRIYTGEVEVRLDATASGQPLVVNQGGKLRDVAQWRVANGVLTCQ